MSVHLTNDSHARAVQIQALDHLEFWVANPRLSAHFYETTFGLRPAAYAGPETGVHDRLAFVVTNGSVRFVLTGPVGADGPLARYVTLHGDGVRDIAFLVDDVETAFHAALLRGARPVCEPRIQTIGDRRVGRASIAAVGDVVHSFIERGRGEWWLPGFEPCSPRREAEAARITSVDHVAVTVPAGQLEAYVAFYTRVFGFHVSHEEYVTTEHTGMNSRVVESPDGRIRFPLLEPRSGARKSQIQEFIESNGGPGVQHAALHSNDIVSSVSALRASGVDFMGTPAAYYERLLERVACLEEDVSRLQDLNILVDKDSWGYLLQIFSKPVQARPTFFVEVIQRKGARGFGSGNIKALFEAVEREQRRRQHV